MKKKAKKQKKANPVPKKIDKELEIRVKEEQERLKKKKTAKTPKKQKKDKDISDKVKIIKKSKVDEQKKLDYHRFLEAQMQKLDYAAAFSYLGNNVKTNKYEYGAEDERVKAVYVKDETISWDKVKFYVDEHKMNSLMGLRRDFENNDERQSYKWWAAFNQNMSFLLFQLSYT